MRSVLRPTFTARSVESLNRDLLGVHMRTLAIVPRLVVVDLDDTIMEHHAEQVRPAALNLLHWLHETMGTEQVALISNAQPARAPRVRRVADDLDRRLNMPVRSYISSDYRSPKPWQPMYRAALADAGVPPTEMFAMGDLLRADIAGANLAGAAATLWFSEPLTEGSISIVRDTERWAQAKLAGVFKGVLSVDKNIPVEYRHKRLDEYMGGAMPDPDNENTLSLPLRSKQK